MKVVGLITEYNPFHRGHEYHIAQAKALTGADFAVAVMSGNYVQRGAPAIFPKHIRTEMALVGGADLVLELPVHYATASAEQFAYGAVSMLKGLGVVDAVCFGCECGDVSVLTEIAQILTEEPQEYRLALREALQQGMSYPVARARALPAYEDILICPNNILGIEYCKALLRLGSPMEPVAINRRGNAYHETALDHPLTSATALRRVLIEEKTESSLQKYLSPEIYAILKREYETGGFLTEDDFSQILIYRLLTVSKAELCQYADMSEELAARILHMRCRFRSFSRFADLLKTKELTRTRINRALLHVILGLKKEIPGGLFAQVLGFAGGSRALLGEIKKQSSLPLLTKPADSEKVLDERQQALFSENLEASMLYEAVSAGKSGRPMVHEFSRSIVIL